MPALCLPLLYEFCEFFGIEYTIGIPANCVFRAPLSGLGHIGASDQVGFAGQQDRR